MKKEKRYITSCIPIVEYEKTMNLRYAKKVIPIDENTGTYELRLQQMWQGSDGSEKWEWIEEVEN